MSSEYSPLPPDKIQLDADYYPSNCNPVTLQESPLCMAAHPKSSTVWIQVGPRQLVQYDPLGAGPPLRQWEAPQDAQIMGLAASPDGELFVFLLPDDPQQKLFIEVLDASKGIAKDRRFTLDRRCEGPLSTAFCRRGNEEPYILFVDPVAGSLGALDAGADSPVVVWSVQGETETQPDGTAIRWAPIAAAADDGALWLLTEARAQSPSGETSPSREPRCRIEHRILSAPHFQLIPGAAYPFAPEVEIKGILTPSGRPRHLAVVPGGDPGETLVAVSCDPVTLPGPLGNDPDLAPYNGSAAILHVLALTQPERPAKTRATFFDRTISDVQAGPANTLLITDSRQNTLTLLLMRGGRFEFFRLSEKAQEDLWIPPLFQERVLPGASRRLLSPSILQEGDWLVANNGWTVYQLIERTERGLWKVRTVLPSDKADEELYVEPSRLSHRWIPAEAHAFAHALQRVLAVLNLPSFQPIRDLFSQAVYPPDSFGLIRSVRREALLEQPRPARARASLLGPAVEGDPAAAALWNACTAILESSATAQPPAGASEAAATADMLRSAITLLGTESRQPSAPPFHHQLQYALSVLDSQPPHLLTAVVHAMLAFAASAPSGLPTDLDDLTIRLHWFLQYPLASSVKTLQAWEKREEQVKLRQWSRNRFRLAAAAAASAVVLTAALIGYSIFPEPPAPPDGGTTPPAPAVEEQRVESMRDLQAVEISADGRTLTAAIPKFSAESTSVFSMPDIWYVAVWRWDPGQQRFVRASAPLPLDPGENPGRRLDFPAAEGGPAWDLNQHLLFLLDSTPEAAEERPPFSGLRGPEGLFPLVTQGITRMPAMLVAVSPEDALPRLVIDRQQLPLKVSSFKVGDEGRQLTFTLSEEAWPLLQEKVLVPYVGIIEGKNNRPRYFEAQLGKPYPVPAEGWSGQISLTSLQGRKWQEGPVILAVYPDEEAAKQAPLEPRGMNTGYFPDVDLLVSVSEDGRAYIFPKAAVPQEIRPEGPAPLDKAEPAPPGGASGLKQRGDREFVLIMDPEEGADAPAANLPPPATAVFFEPDLLPADLERTLTDRWGAQSLGPAQIQAWLTSPQPVPAEPEPQTLLLVHPETAERLNQAEGLSRAAVIVAVGKDSIAASVQPTAVLAYLLIVLEGALGSPWHVLILMSALRVPERDATLFAHDRYV